IRQRVERDSVAPHFAPRTRMVRIEAAVSRQIGHDVDTGLPHLEQALEPRVAHRTAHEPGNGPNSPKPPAVHRRMDAAGIGKLAGLSEVSRGIETLEVVDSVNALGG